MAFQQGSFQYGAFQQQAAESPDRRRAQVYWVIINGRAVPRLQWVEV